MVHGDPIPKKKKEKYVKNARVKAKRQIQKTVKILMVLNILKLVKLIMIHMNPNDSLRNAG